jgi:hypothetical protein
MSLIRAIAQNTIRLKAIVPLSFLVLTCCMAQVEAGARPQPEDGKSPLTTQVSGQPAHSQVSAAQPNTLTIAGNVSDPVQEGRKLLGQKTTDSGAKKSKDKGKVPTKRLDASAEEEEEEEEDEEADEEPTTGKGSAEGGAAMGRSKSIQCDFDQNVRCTLTSLVVRGAVLSAEVSLSFGGGGKDKKGKEKNESEYLGSSLDGQYTYVLDYETGTTYSIKKIDGFAGGRLKAGQEVKTLRATFDAPPKNVKTVGITIYGIGTFDDVKLGAPGGVLSGKPTGSAKTEDIEEEEGEEDVEEEDSKGLTGKKGAKKGTKKGAPKGAK